ncbi:hypothetical protein BCR34DRAFT_653499, partial [Clohesyomyces aquaticus]
IVQPDTRSCSYRSTPTLPSNPTHPYSPTFQLHRHPHERPLYQSLLFLQTHLIASTKTQELKLTWRNCIPALRSERLNIWSKYGGIALEYRMAHGDYGTFRNKHGNVLSNATDARSLVSQRAMRPTMGKTG